VRSTSPAAPGSTATSAGLHATLADQLQQVRAVTGLPVITGIGITGPDRAAEAAAAGADAVILGSAVTAATAIPKSAVGEDVRELITRCRMKIQARHDQEAARP
jgi:tryptophan synthase alpha subunit